ncbi:hypothetical protein PCE1_003304 [Barthelona sp. PCE]
MERKLEDLFNLLDFDSNGRLRRDDLLYFTSRLNLPLSKEEIDLAIAEIELTGNGIDRVAFFNFIASKVFAGSHIDLAVSTFGLIDPEHKGKLDMADILELVHLCGFKHITLDNIHELFIFRSNSSAKESLNPAEWALLTSDSVTIHSNAPSAAETENDFLNDMSPQGYPHINYTTDIISERDVDDDVLSDL